jgi:D-glycero-alpha-D-manno-heptose-7-phosphate kinase
MIISRTPFRISFFGGGTDYPAWYRQHGGAVVATTIDKYCYLTCRFLPPFFEHRIRVVYSKIENCHEVSEIQHPAVREILRYLGLERGVEIHHDGDLPARSGMGSSSAFTVGLLHALHGLLGRMPSKRQLAREAIVVEQERIRETVGSQDQVLAAYGGFNHIHFPEDGDAVVRPVTLGRERLAALNDHLMLCYSGRVRTASDVAETYVHDLDSRRRQLRLLGEMVDEAIDILSGSGDLTPFGKLLDEAWQAKRSLSPSVSHADVEAIYAEATAAGAVGGKLLGAGGGGFMLLFVPPERQAALKERLRRLVFVPFRFESSGSQIIFFDAEAEYPLEERRWSDRRSAGGG